ncbi:hypothetical protein BQ9231_00048 [Cedratvirus lausannensis]|uniref:Transmembrane protein n=1 Tax=Cedratvirus lausannensis TaxID=2023205 RepID=A0A285PWE4_9VIRU|nr:hypothetical protein BQ9231_00048 [Cedratvirus lausannensis]
MSQGRTKVIAEAYLEGLRVFSFPIGMAVGFEESNRKRQSFSVGLFRVCYKSVLYSFFYPLSIPYMLMTFPDVEH